MKRRRGRAVCGAATVAAALLVGCDATDPLTDTETSTVVTTATESATMAGPSSTTSDAAPADTLPVSSEPSRGAALTTTDIRVGEHGAFDRVVIEFGGAGTPGYDIRFTDDPRQDGSGDPVTVPGRTVIQLVISGVGYPGDTGVTAFRGPNPVPGVGAITDIAWAGVFEGQSRVFVGVDTVRPAVRVSTLTSPTRLVLDIGR